jgi:glucose-1-phosphate cytidylyltransferase
MKTVIFCGGKGTRMGSQAQGIPKCLVEIGGKPIIEHLLRYYSSYGHNSFVLCLGYYGNQIKSYFANYKLQNQNITIDMASGQIHYAHHDVNWEVTLVDTGLDSQTGARLGQVRKYVELEEDFLVNYADGLSDVNINDVVDFHLKTKRLATLTAVHPVSRFGEVEISDDGTVQSFVEKPIGNSWINGGFFVMNNRIFNHLDDNPIELGLLIALASTGQLGAYRHLGFFSPCDSPKDLAYLNDLYDQKEAPWLHSWRKKA